MAQATAPTSNSEPPASRQAPERERRRALGDPLAPILALGRRQLRVGAAIGIAGALFVHAAPATQAVRSLADLRAFALQAREVIQERLRAELDVDLDRPPPPPPPPPPPEPEPPPPAQQAPPKAPQEEPPPAPAQAAKVLTQEPDPNEPVDLTGEGFVTGNADRFAGGVTANTGTSTKPVRDLNATPLGVPGGTGTAKAPVPVEDRSRPAIHDTSVSWNDCGFTPEADLEGINEAVVVLAVTVGENGRPKSVSVIKDPGFGFGRLARTCAMRKPFVVGLDRAGKPMSMTTAPFRVIFRR